MNDADVEVEGLIPIPNRGTVVVGTVVLGSVRVGEQYDFRGVRARCLGIEIGRELLTEAREGDRVGILLDAAFPDA